MIGEGDVAVGAFHDVSAVAAGDEGAVSPTVDEEDALLLCSDHLRDRRLQRSAKDRAVPMPKFLPHVYDLNRGHGRN